MSLQTEGEGIVKDLALDELLNRFGEAHLVGNLALSTTVKPDIDYLVYLEQDKWTSTIQELKQSWRVVVS